MSTSLLDLNLHAVDLKGSEKQIAWAEKIRRDLVESVNEESVPQIRHLFKKDSPKTKEFMTFLKANQTSNANVNNQLTIWAIRDIIAQVEDATIFIENQSLISFLKEVL